MRIDSLLLGIGKLLKSFYNLFKYLNFCYNKFMQQKLSSIFILATFFLIGLVQGMGFSTIPAASNFLTSSAGFLFNPEQYGALFLPMFVGAIFASFFGGLIAKKIGIKSVFSLGQIFNIFSMLIFALSGFYLNQISISFPLFLALMLCIGLGFGAVLTSLNSFAFFFFPKRSKTALTALHSCLGIGTAIGPLSFAYFLKHGAWWYDPIWIGTLYFLLLLAALVGFPNPHQLTLEKKVSSKKLPIASPILWSFIAIALLYGICETTFGNWGPIFLHHGKNLMPASTDFALSLFWGTITLGRIATVLLSFVAPARYLYCSLPPIILIGLILLYPSIGESWLFLSFAIAGLGCSAMLPLSVGFAQERFASIAPLISGMMIGTYMLGFGLASQGVGLIYKFLHIPFSTLFASLSGPVILLFLLCVFVTTHEERVHH
jgi:MFS transporter, FHS family, glucose/mannose:H+ symporter